MKKRVLVRMYDKMGYVKVRIALYNIKGTDNYYVSGKALDYKLTRYDHCKLSFALLKCKKESRFGGIVEGVTPLSIADLQHQHYDDPNNIVTDIPTYVRKVCAKYDDTLYSLFENPLYTPEQEGEQKL